MAGIYAGLSGLSNFPHLRNLVIEDTSCPLLTQPQGLAQLSVLTRLTCLCLHNVEAKFDTFRDVLFGLTCLCSLTLSSRDWFLKPCEGLENSLSRLCHLRDLDLSGLAVSWAILFANAGLTRLAISVPSTPYSSFNLVHNITLPVRYEEWMVTPQTVISALLVGPD